MRTITIYSTPTCPYCKQLKEYLTEKGIPFTDHDVSADETARADMERLSGGLSVPVVVFGKDTPDQEVQIGYDKSKVEEALQK